MKNILIAFIVLVFIACGSDDNKTTDFTTQNEKEISTYINDNNLTAIRSDSGLYYIIDNAGNGPQPTGADNVTVAYKGYFTNGEVFDQSDSNGISFNLRQVIAGWTEGITYFNEGGSGILLVPSHLGYGSDGRGRIPGGAVLIFDIELKSIN